MKREHTFDVVGVGLNAMDTICVVPHLPERNEKVEIRTVRLEPGGQVATALATCSRLGLRVRYIGSVGSDDLGWAQMESLRREGLDVELVRVVEGATSQMAVILVEEGVGERTILWHRDSRLTYPVDSLSREAIILARVLHLDGRDSAAALQAAQWAREAGIPIVIDIDQIYDPTTETLLRTADYLIAAEDFAYRVAGEDSAENAVLALHQRYRCDVVGITLGSRGAVFYTDGKILRSRAFDVLVADTTGAGDVFHGAFIYGLLQGWPLPEIVRFAHAIAAMKCMKIGARAGIPNLIAAQDFLKTARHRV